MHFSHNCIEIDFILLKSYNGITRKVKKERNGSDSGISAVLNTSALRRRGTRRQRRMRPLPGMVPSIWVSGLVPWPGTLGPWYHVPGTLTPWFRNESYLVLAQRSSAVGGGASEEHPEERRSNHLLPCFHQFFFQPLPPVEASPLIFFDHDNNRDNPFFVH